MQLNMMLRTSSLALSFAVGGLSLAMVLDSAAADPAVSSVLVENLRCEYQANPLAVEAPHPRLSWVLNSDERGQKQTACQVLVASSIDRLERNEADLWDTGKIDSRQAVHVEYKGKPLSSRTRCFWKVRVWDKDGNPTKYASPARWEMGLLTTDDWKARWIRRSEPAPKTDADRFNDRPAPLLRKEFDLAKPISRARVYVTGLGYYELRLNGQRVGDRVLDPAWTTYARRVLYSTYDVTDQLRQGRNALGVMLGNGWYDPLPLRFWGHLNLRQHLAIGAPRLILQLMVDFADGTSETIFTDETWKTTPGPVLRNSVYLGELYDARREQPGWDAPDFKDSSWQPAVLAEDPVGPLESQSAPPIRVTRRLRPVKRTQPAPGTYIFDFGQNFAGCVTLRAKGPAGTAVRLRYGELLYPDGTLNGMTTVAGQIKAGGSKYVYPGQGEPKTAWQCDGYVLKGGGEETYTPRFTFHGFRYVEVTGYPGEPALDAIEGLRLNSDVEHVGAFACSNERFNRIQSMAEWTFLSNLLGVQSDCPGREKFGYGGDIVGTSEAYLCNFDMSGFYAKTVRDFADAVRANGGFTETAPYVGISDEGLGGGSGPVGWGTAFPHLLWQLYTYYGDRRLLEQYYPMVPRWVELLQSRAKDGILDNGISDHESLVPKPRALTGTAFYYYNVSTLARIAGVLGKTEDTQRFAALAEDIKKSFNRRFLKPGTGAYDAATQACQAFALFLDLVPDETKAPALQVLVRDVLESRQGHLTTGLFGTRFLPLVLSDAGRMDVAYTVVNQKDFPGWGHMIERGATTVWEHWEFSDNTFSHNHPMFGSVSEWLFKAVAGIQPDPEMVGYDRLVIRPQPTADLVWAKGEFKSVRGPILSDWKVADGQLTLRVSLPPNTTATVFVPTGDPASVSEGGKPASQSNGIRLLRQAPAAAVYQVESGRYEFKAPVAK